MLRQVLQEHNVDTRKTKKDMVVWLQQFDDAKYELNTVQHYLIKDLGHQCIFLPKAYSRSVYISALLTAMLYVESD